MFDYRSGCERSANFPDCPTCMVMSPIYRTRSIIVLDLVEKVHTLPGPDYFDEEAKCYSKLFEFFQVIFCRSKQWGRITLAKF